LAPAFDPGTARETARRTLERAFEAAAIEAAALDARVLLCAALAIDHASLVRDPGHLLGAAAARVQSFAERRLKREPVSRILGYKEFWGARFALDPAVLDPRPDTETLVEALLGHAGGELGLERRILDLGVGSGAILCALLRNFTKASGVGVDLSPQACAIARRNLALLGLASRALILCGNWAAPIRGGFDIIVSNPPYIAHDQIACLEPEVRDHDPALALDGGADGLAAYRLLSPSLPNLLAPGGVVALECGAGQRKDVDVILRGAGLSPFAVRLDLAGAERVILARAGTVANQPRVSVIA
jgi:release factor glutamine methyltransferase